MSDRGDDTEPPESEVERLRRELEEERRRRARLEQFVRQTNDGIMVHDADGDIVDATEPMCELVGYSKEELLDLHVSDLTIPWDREIAHQTWASVLEGRVRTFEAEMERPDGTRVPISVELRPHGEEEDGLILAVIRDITNRRRTETMLEARDRMYHTVFRHSVEAIYLADPSERRILQANPAFCDLLGYDGTEVRHLSLADVHADGAAALDEFLQRLDDGESISNLERTWRRADGTEIDVEVTASGVELPSSNTDVFFVVARDVTEEKRLRSKMIQMDRMIATGTLAAGVGHEINNPLSYVIANLQFSESVLESHFDDGDSLRSANPDPLAEDLCEVRDALAEAEQGARRIHEIVGDLKILAEPDRERSLEPVSVGRILSSSVNIVWNEIRKRATFVREIGSIPKVRATESRLGQILVNLLMNAAQAIPPGDADEHEIRVEAREEDEVVAIEVRDTGHGIPPEARDRIFDPFFTTKQEDEGTGLGLAITRRLVDAMGGTIDVESKPEETTTFTVRLEAADEDDVLAETADAANRRRPKGLSILVIDSDPKMGPTFERLLGDEHDLAFTSSWADAKVELDGSDEFDVVFCDLMMRNATAAEMYQWVQQHASGLVHRLVFMTGDSFSEQTSRLVERSPNPCLLKPLDRESLRSTISDLLGRS